MFVRLIGKKFVVVFSFAVQYPRNPFEYVPSNERRESYSDQREIRFFGFRQPERVNDYEKHQQRRRRRHDLESFRYHARRLPGYRQQVLSKPIFHS